MESVRSDAFKEYGKVIDGHDFAGLISKLEECSKKPADRVIYVSSCDELEDDPAAKVLRDNVFGGMPIQIGYCNGSNKKLNCFEYHRNSEVNIAADDAVLIVAKQQAMDEGIIDTACAEMFFLPKGTAVELYGTTLHYAPCEAKKGNGFRVMIVLPRGTNTKKPDIDEKNWEDRLLFANNKWLTAHPDSDEAKNGAFIGIRGRNIDIEEETK